MFFSKESALVKGYAAQNWFSVEQIERSMLRHTGRDGDVWTILTNVAFVLFMNTGNLVVAVGALLLSILGFLLGVSGATVVGVLIATVCFLGFCAFLCLQWKHDRVEHTRMLWSVFLEHVKVFSEATGISEDILFTLSQEELRAIARRRLEQMARDLKDNEANPNLKKPFREEFKRVHSSLYILGVAEGAWDKYF